jgi:glucose-6-phosphate 1-epimerase
MISTSDTVQEFGATHSAPLLKIETEQATCLLSLYGAHVLSYQAKSREPLLWVSPHAIFDGSVPIRGGIPVCAPWFGLNQRHHGKLKHGFVRSRLWSIVQKADDSVLLEYQSTDDDLARYTRPFTAQLKVSVGEGLRLDFSILNRSHKPMPFSWALHSYHPVSELAACKVTGLDGCDYLDNTKGLSRKQQAGDVGFAGELDRVYLNVPNEQQIDHKIKVSAENAPTAIVWNPGEKLAENMADVQDAWNQYICLERGAAFDNDIKLAAGDTMSATVELGYC